MEEQEIYTCDQCGEDFPPQVEAGLTNFLTRVDSNKNELVFCSEECAEQWDMEQEG